VNSIDGIERKTDKRRQGRGVNDGAAAAPPEQRHRQVRAQNHGAQVHINDPLPLVARGLREVERAGGDAGVVAEDVHATVTLFGGREHAARIRFACDVGLDCRRSTPNLCDACHRFAGSGIVEICNDH
jgi:hypothetical protein